LRDIQHQDGHWSDYALPVGQSDQWVTGFVGSCLAGAGRSGQSASSEQEREQARQMAIKASQWLERHRAYAAGWGYHDKSGPDTDSTAYAIRLFELLGLPVRHEDRQFIWEHWHVDGGFSTYKGPLAWGEPHPCVTPLAFLALSAERQRQIRPRLLYYMRSMRQTDGLWPSYWWRQPFYSTYIHLGVYRELVHGEALSLSFEPDGWQAWSAFDLASFIGAAQLCGWPSSRLEPLVHTLLATQKPNGSWQGAHNLRVTSPECRKPWEQPVGEYFKDFHCTITTAMAVKVLSELRL
jgi:hypothetical protein